MIKIICSNPVCGLQFHFDQERFPNAKKVKCPHCDTIQPISGGPMPERSMEEPESDWFKKGPTPDISTPHAREEPDWKEEDSSPGNDDFSFSAPSAPKQSRPDQGPRPVNPQRPYNTPQPSSTEVAWLVIHDEATASETFSLRAGLNRIGRESQNTPHDVNIMIRTNDTYMSREHCEIDARWNVHNSSYEFILTDKKSKNGTYVNGGKKLSSQSAIRLKDRDTIQIGRTKMVLVLPSSTLDRQQASDLVGGGKYFHTIIEN